MVLLAVSLSLKASEACSFGAKASNYLHVSSLSQIRTSQLNLKTLEIQKWKSNQSKLSIYKPKRTFKNLYNLSL